MPLPVPYHQATPHVYTVLFCGTGGGGFFARLGGGGGGTRLLSAAAELPVDVAGETEASP